MKSRTPLIAGNWKMHKTGPEAVGSACKLVELTADTAGVETMIAPTFTALSEVAEAIGGSQIRLGAQNLHWETHGAFTGEISGDMLTAAGCQYVIIGHSERRQYFGDTDEIVNKKVTAALSAGLNPILCIGETETQREADETFNILDKQVQKGLEDLSENDLNTLVIAYEPVWAIGTGKTATTEQAQEVHLFVRSLIDKKFGKALAQSLRILYGGSVKPSNVKELMGMPDLDGALVGGASLDPETFSQLVHFQS
ncbi:MAG: triose-phosphate isomerase [Desulfobacteraceae bacterium]|nr:triose-phosphate isomerase [Desulfobacteraceae bacterium]